MESADGGKGVMLWRALLVALLLAGSSFARAQTVSRPMDFAVGFVCPGGGLPTDCANPTRLTATDPLPYERGDYGNPEDPDGIFQIVFATMCGSDAHSGCAILNWDFSHEYHSGPTFTPTTAAFGYGGEVYRGGDQGWLRIVETRDGGTDHDQFFCGPTGWTAYAAQAPTGRWAEAVAHLNIEPAPGPCTHPLNDAYTQWRAETLPLLFRINGVFQTLQTVCVISRHYDAATYDAANNLEEAVYGFRWGRLGWFKYSKAPAVNLGSRLPQLPWPGPGGAWEIQDGRLNTNVVVRSPPLPQLAFGWPAAGSTP